MKRPLFLPCAAIAAVAVLSGCKKTPPNPSKAPNPDPPRSTNPNLPKNPSVPNNPTPPR
jgi:hypothetical protein